MIAGLGRLACAVSIKFGVRNFNHIRIVSNNFCTFKVTIMDIQDVINSIPLKIGTHNEVFHCDEVLACYMLMQLNEYANSKIIRTRDENILKDCDVVIDVGAVYDKSKHRYDHHQREFQETFSSLRPEFGSHWTIRLSSAGLIYVHFGENIIQSIYQKHTGNTLSEHALKAVYVKVYENFIQEIDAIDNGIPMYEGEPLYRISTNLSNRVGNFNPSWNSTEKVNQDDIFKIAMSYAGKELDDRILYYANSWWPARKLIEDCLSERSHLHSSKQIMEFKEVFPWKEHLFDIEKEQNIEGVVKYVIFPSSGVWRVQAVPLHPKSYVCRKFLKSEWWGLRDHELEKVSGIPDSIFCHATGFIGGNKTRDGALKMAIDSLIS